MKTTIRMSISAMIVMTFLLGGLLPMFPLAAALNDPADTHANVHVTGDWIVQDTRTYTAGTTITMDNGNVVVQNGGVLSLDASAIGFNPTAHGNKGIIVEKGGTLKIANGGGITSLTPNTYHCAFLKGSIISLKDANLWWAGGSTATTPDTGIFIGADNVTIHHMIFRENRQSTPLMQIDGKNVTIDNSTFGVYNNRGIVIQGQANLYDNTIMPLPGPVTTGIVLQNGGNATLIHNDIYGMSTGISILQSKAVLIGNSIHNNNQNGIMAIFDANVVLRENNIIQNNIMDGIYAAFDADITIQKDNMIRNNQQYGLNAYSGGNFTVKGSTIRDNIDGNVAVYNSKASLEECTLIGPVTAVSVTGSEPVHIKDTTFDQSMGTVPIIRAELDTDITIEGSHFKNGILAFYEINNANLVSKKNDFTAISNIVMMEIHSNYEGYSNTITGANVYGFVQMRSTLYSENDKYTGPAAPTTMFMVSSDGFLEVHKMVADHVDNSVFVAAQFGGKALIYDTLANFAGTAVLFSVDSTITSINSSIPLSKVTALGKGKINLGWHTLVKTQWQNGAVAPSAQVKVVNGTAKQTETFTTGVDGLYDTDTLQWTSTATGDINQNNLNFTATLNGMSGSNKLNISKNWIGATPVVILLQDTKAPQLTIGAPVDNYLTQKGKFTINGTATDNDSGLASVKVDTGTGFKNAIGLDTWSLDLDLTEGVYDIKVQVTDVAGLMTEKTIQVEIDQTAPALALTAPVGLYINTTSFALNGTTDADMKVTVDGEVVTNDNGNFGTQLSKTDGEYTIIVNSTDLVGNVATVTKHIIIDTVAPTLSSDVADGTWFNKQHLTLTGHSDGEIVLVNGMIADMDKANKTWSSLQLLNEGTNDITMIAKDLANNTIKKTMKVQIDTAQPVITPLTFDGTGPYYTNKATANLTGKVSDSNLMNLTINGAPVSFDTKGNYTSLLTLKDGQNVLTVSAKDKAGNSAQWQTTIVLDTKAPVVTITSPKDGLVTNSNTMQVTGKVDDIVAALKYGTANVTNTNGTFTTTATVGSSGVTVTITATDLAGNVGNATIKINFDGTALLTITTPKKVKVSSTANSMKLVGTSEKGATVTVNDLAVPVDANGGFSLKLTLKEGKNTFVVKMTDPAGNTNMQTVTATYTNSKQYDINMLLGLGIVLMIIGLIVGVVVGKVMSKPKTPKPVEEYPEAPTKSAPKVEDKPFEPEEEPEEAPKPAPKEQPKVEPKPEPKPEPKVEPKPAPKPQAKQDSSLDDMLKSLDKK